MEKVTNWRDLLKEIISDPEEKARLIEMLGINPVTITRWISGYNNPRQEKLQILLNALPAYRERLISLFKHDFPEFTLDLSQPEQQQPLEINSDFYEMVLRMFAANHPSRSNMLIQEALLSQLCDQLDGARQGIVAMFTQCVKPRPGQKVHSLRMLIGHGFSPWPASFDGHAPMMGIESQVGAAIQSGHPELLRNKEERLQMFPHHHRELSESSIAYPVMRGDNVAGCLLIISTIADYFSPERVSLVKAYADLACLAFDDNDFYPLSRIKLGAMPGPALQKPYLDQFQQRVARHLEQAMRRDEALRRPEAELQVWQELESELIQLDYQRSSTTEYQE